MKHFRKCIPVMIVLVAGCAAGKPSMKLDPALEANATAYDVTKGRGLFEKMYQISFGPYRVTDAASGWTKSGPGNLLSWTDFVGGNHFSISREQTSVIHSYKFTAGDQAPWDAECALLARTRGLKVGGGRHSVTQTTSDYVCQYTREGSKAWGLSISQVKDSPALQVEMASEAERFTAFSDRGGDAASGSPAFKIMLVPNTGFTWKQGDDIVAAVSVKATAQRVWLDNRNSTARNEVLAMASAGLLIYHMKIVPTLADK